MVFNGFKGVAGLSEGGSRCFNMFCIVLRAVQGFQGFIRAYMFFFKTFTGLASLSKFFIGCSWCSRVAHGFSKV